MDILVKSINGWVPPSPVKCTPKQITQVDSEVNSVGDLTIKSILSVKMCFEIEWKDLTESQVRSICAEFADFNALVSYEDFSDGVIKQGRFYPSDRQPIPALVYKNGEKRYDSFPLNIVEK